MTPNGSLVKHTGWQGIIRNNYFQGLAQGRCYRMIKCLNRHQPRIIGEPNTQSRKPSQDVSLGHLSPDIALVLVLRESWTSLWKREAWRLSHDF